jgi:hypothetical protein
MVQIGTTKYGPYTPQSSTSFNKVVVTPPFTVAQANSMRGLTFVGYGAGNAGQLLSGEVTAVFITEVTITQVAPQIDTSTCPSDIDPTSTVKLSGKNFGPGKGKIRIAFSKQSRVDFANKAFANDKSKSNLDLSVRGQWRDSGTIESEALDSASPAAAPPAQQVEITVINANGLSSSNSCKANFHNKPVITGLTSGSITPNQSFNVWGWDFGDDPGKVTVHFTNNNYHSASLDSHDDVDAEVNKNAHGKYEWQPWVISVVLPKNFGGVIEQDVDISATPKGGSASNSLKAEFKPRIVETTIPTNLISVQSCSNGGAANLCNEPNGGSITCFGANVAENIVFQTETTASVDLPNIQISLYGAHFGCPAGSDSGTDVYQAAVHSPWTIASVQYFDAVYQAGWNPTASGLLSTLATISVPWETSDDGGGIIYEIVVEAQGPQGMPLQ